MEIRNYCEGVEVELSSWRDRLNDATRKVDALSSGERERVLSNIQDINIILTELEDKLDFLKTECPIDWLPHKEEINAAHIDMRSKYEETLAYIGKAAPVSIPG